MFKYYLNLDNEMTYKRCYEVHKKNCPIVKQMLNSGSDQLLDLGFHKFCDGAMMAAKEALAERALDPSLLNGCLACNKEYHKR